MSVQDVLDNRLLLFGGKGGVGKTTCAAATAIALCPKKTLLISLDPAHSLSDCLAQTLGHETIRVEGVSHLYAVEVDPARTLEEFKAVYRRAILRVLETSAGFQYLTPREREGLLSLPIPGAEEVMLLKSVLDVMDEGDYEVYIVDTAPTADALRLLSMPEVFDHWVSLFYSLRAKRRNQGGAFRHPDYGDQFLQTMKENAGRLGDLLRSPDTEFAIVTSAERLAVEETKDLVRALRAFGVPVRRLLVNKLFPDLGIQFARTKRKEEQANLAQLAEELDNVEIHKIFLQVNEPRGLENLVGFASQLYGSTRVL